MWDKTTARLSEGFKLEPEPAVLRSAQEAAEVATMAVGADPQAAGVRHLLPVLCTGGLLSG